jgi:hypothetical protein
MNLHLSHEQLCDLIFAELSLEPQEDRDVVHEHLRACLICSAELENLRDSLILFRDASASLARQEFAHYHARRSSIAPPHSVLAQPLYWAAAIMVIVAALFPLSMRRQSPPPAPQMTAQSIAAPAESDAALLADIDQEISSDVPAPMEPLTATAPETSISSPSDLNNSRKN